MTSGCSAANVPVVEMMSKTRMPMASCSEPVITKLPPLAIIWLTAPPNAQAMATSPESKAATAAGPPSDWISSTEAVSTPRYSSIFNSLKWVPLPNGV